MGVPRIVENSLEVFGAVRPGDILPLGQVRQRTGTAEEHKNNADIKHVPKIPAADERHQANQTDSHPRDVNGTPHLIFASEKRQLEKLKQEQEIPVRTRGGKRLGRISRRTQMRAVVPQHNPKHHHRHREARHDIFEDLIWPKASSALDQRLGWRDAVTAEQINMPDDQQHQQPRKHTGVQRKKASQCVMPVLGATDDEFLHIRPGKRHEVHQVGGNTGGPKSFLIPRQQVAGQRQSQHEQQ